MKRLVVCVMLFSFLCTGCKKLKQLANIDINIPYSQNVTLPVVNTDTSGILFSNASVSTPAFGFSTGASQTLADYHTSPDKIVYVKLRSLSMKILKPAGQNFSFLDTMRIYISAESQPEVLAAYQYNIPKDADSISLTSNGQNLKDYFLANTMYLRLQGHFSTVPTTGPTVRIYSAFNMLANPLY